MAAISSGRGWFRSTRRNLRYCLLLALTSCLIALLTVLSATGVECENGEPVSAGLGDGVTLHSCSWEKSPGEFVRTGPLLLVRNGILILQLHTGSNGKLQGEFNSWDDEGAIQQSGHYVNGQKNGEWRVTASNGDIVTLQFLAGTPISL